MYVDALFQLSGTSIGNTIAGQTVTGASAVLSTNTVDLGVNRDIGAGASPSALFQVATAFAGLSALECQLVVADDAALSSNVTVIGSTGAIPVAQLTAGARFIAQMNTRLMAKGQRYIGARYVPTGTGTAGAMYCSLVQDMEDAKVYPSGWGIA